MQDLTPFYDAVVAWAADRSDVDAVFLVGSQARSDAPADQFSDVDLVLVVDRPARFLESESWLEPFGHALLTFVEETAVGGQRERRVLFRSGLEVDFAFVRAADFRHLAAEPEAAAVFARGYRVLYDEVGASEAIAHAAPQPAAHPLEAAELRGLSHDFWYHALWAAKKLRRGEIYVAKQACDCYLKALLVSALAACGRSRNPRLDTWHRARFLERWATPDDLSELRGTFALYEEGDVADAIAATAELFERLERELSANRHLELQVDHTEVRRRLDALLDPYGAGR